MSYLYNNCRGDALSANSSALLQTCNAFQGIPIVRRGGSECGPRKQNLACKSADKQWFFICHSICLYKGPPAYSATSDRGGDACCREVRCMICSCSSIGSSSPADLQPGSVHKSNPLSRNPRLNLPGPPQKRNMQGKAILDVKARGPGRGHLGSYCQPATCMQLLISLDLAEQSF